MKEKAGEILGKHLLVWVMNSEGMNQTLQLEDAKQFAEIEINGIISFITKEFGDKSDYFDYWTGVLSELKNL